jgi:hypothetical protein
MDMPTTVLLGLSAVLLITTVLALLQRNERRDVALLAVMTGLLGMGTLASAIG